MEGYPFSKEMDVFMNPTRPSKFQAVSPAMKRLNATLLILVGAGIFIFGLNVLFLALTALVTQLVFEILFAYYRDKKIDEGWVYNALILVLLLPPSLPLWIGAVGTAFAAVFGKLVFGGYPKYVFNPALVGIIFLTISFPSFMSTQWLDPVTGLIGTGTPIGSWGRGLDVLVTYPLMNLFTGMAPGLIGEVSRGLILVLGLLLVVTKTIDWKAPFFFLASFVGLGYLGNYLALDKFYDPFTAVLVGNVIFASVFLVSDKPTLPTKAFARILYGFFLAVFTLLIRIYAAWPEGVIFALVIMNAISPLLDSLVSGKSVTDVTLAEVK
jgi:electron transport complex protein RnfD